MNIDKLIENFSFAAIHKSTSATTLINFLDLPSDVKTHLLTKFSEKTGDFDAFALSEYVKEMRLKPDEWNIKLLEARHSAKGSFKLLTKVVIEFDYAKDQICFSLPEYGFPKKKGEAIVDWSTVAVNKEHLLTPNGCWGEVLLTYDCGVINLTDFKPLCPYTYNLTKYRKKREQFTTKEWIDVLLSGLNFNPDVMSEEQKLTLLQRFLPFVEKRLHLMELAIKGSSKSYCYSQLSPHSWLTAGTVSRATAFYNNTSKKPGYFIGHDVVCWDEVQSISAPNGEELNGILKAALESGEIRIGGFMGSTDASFVMLGNANTKSDNIVKVMPKWLKEAPFIDRFCGMIEGEKVGKFTNKMHYEGWALSHNYLTEIFHLLREEFYYRAIVDELVIPDGDCDQRNLEAIKKNCTAFLKLLFPNVTRANEVDKKEFRKYCLEPAIKLRANVLNQLQIIDVEYAGIKIPEFKD